MCVCVCIGLSLCGATLSRAQPVLECAQANRRSIMTGHRLTSVKLNNDRPRWLGRSVETHDTTGLRKYISEKAVGPRKYFVFVVRYSS